MEHPILSLPPAAEEPPPENPPETPETHTSSAMLNFRALMMKLAIESSPNKSLTPPQTLILEDKLRQCFPYLRAPDHPPYAWMIRTAIKQLKEDGGSSEEAISECIMNDNSDLPWAHATLLRHHLGKLVEKGEIVQTRDGLYLLNDPITRASPASSPSEFFDATDSPSLSLSSDSSSSSDSLYGKSKRRKPPKKVGNKRMGIPPRRSSGRLKKNIHLKKRKRKVVRSRPPKKSKTKEEISSDEEMEVELQDIVVKEETDAIKAENQLIGQTGMVEVEVVEESHRLEDIKQDGGQEEMQEMTNSSPCEKEEQGAQYMVVEARSDDIEVQNEQKEEDMMKCRNPLGLEMDEKNDDTLKEKIAEMRAMELQDREVQEGTEVNEEQNQSKQLEVMEEEHQESQHEVQVCIENQLQEQKLLEELHPLEASPCSPCDEDIRQEIIPMNEEIEAIEVQGVEEQIIGSQAQKEPEVMEEWYQSIKMEEEDTEEKKRDSACEKDVLLQEIRDVDEGQHKLMQMDVMEEEYQLQLIGNNDQLEKTNLVNDTKFQEKVDESQKEQQMSNEHQEKWRGKEIVHSPKSSSFFDKDFQEYNKDFQESMQIKAEIVQEQNTKETEVLENTDDPEAGRCLRSGKKIKSGQKHGAVQTSICSEHEETIDIKPNDQHEQETVACDEEHSHMKAQMDPDIVCSTDEVEEISSPLQQNIGVSSEEEQQEVQFSEDTEEEQLKHRQLRPRAPKIEPGTQEHQVSHVVLSLQASRRVTRRMAAAQQRKKRPKSQVGEISCMPRRRSARLSLGQSEK